MAALLPGSHAVLGHDKVVGVALELHHCEAKSACAKGEKEGQSREIGMVANSGELWRTPG
jgi:hypothetical protein